MKCDLTNVAAILVAGITVLGAATPPALADQYPSRPIQVVIPFGAGGAIDLQARAMTPVAQQYLGQPLSVVLKPGGGGIIGAAAVARAKPDGYTLLLTTTSPISIAPQIEDTGYSKDSFIPIAQLNQTPVVVAVRADRPWKTLDDLLKHVRANADKVVFGTTTITGVTTIGNHMLLDAAGIRATLSTVPFKGVGDQVLSVLKGDTDYMLQISPGLMPFIRSNQLRALAILSEKRFPLLPEVPTAKELGYNVVAAAWMGVFAPKGTPAQVVDVIARGLAKMVKDPSFGEMMMKVEIPPAFENTNEFQRQVDSEQAAYGDVIRRVFLKKK